MFLFGFYTRGIAFVDIAYLRKSDIQDGAIRYDRHKTGQQHTVCIEPCIQSIISADMGHSSERTMQIYLTLLKNSLIDGVNWEFLENLHKPTS